MRGQLIGDEAGFPGDRVVAVDAPVVSVDEINPLLGADGGARCEQDDKGAGQLPRNGFSKTFDGKLTPHPFFMPVRGAKSSFKFIP